MSKADALSVEEAMNLLGYSISDFKQDGRKRIYNLPIGRVYFRGSKYFGFPNQSWWYSIDPKVVKDEQIDFLCLSADYRGVFLIPSKLFMDYNGRFRIGKVRGGGENFTIKEVKGKMIRKESKCEEWDITQFFINK